MAARKQRNKGYIALELVIVCFLLTLLGTFLIGESQSYINYYQKQQVKTAANILADDIRLLQQQSLFGDGILNRQIKFMSDNNGYGFYVDRKITKRVYFSDLGCEDVYLARKMTMVQYTNTGSPSYNGTIVLKHKDLPGYSCTLAVQPVTGRVVINETK